MARFRISGFVFGLLLLTCAVPPALWGQEARSAISGRVTDPGGAVVVGAKVEALNTATGVRSHAVTNDTGDYLIPYLIPGEYKVSITMPGFEQFVGSAIGLRMDDRMAFNAVLKIGQATETVEVVATANMLDTSTTSMGQVLGMKQTEELPLQNGNLMWAATLSPGVVDTNTASGYVRPIDTGHPSTISVDGTLPGSTQYTIDGAPNMFGNVMAYSRPPGIVEEFKVVGTVFDASYGYFPGATVNLSLKSGVNALHGQTYYFNQNPALGANSFFNNASGQPKAVMTLHRWGATASGPVYIPKLYNGRNRLFWMFGYEGLKSFDPTPFGISAVPTAAERTGDFSKLLALGPSYQIYNPFSNVAAAGGLYSRTPVPGNIIPASLINPAAAGIAKLWDMPNLAGTSAGENNYTLGVNSRDTYYNYIGRMDYNVSEKDRMYIRADKTSNPRPQNYRHNGAEGWTVTRANAGAVIDNVLTLSPTFFIDARYSYNRFTVDYVPNDLGWNLANLGFSSTFINQITQVNPKAIRLPAIVPTGYAALADQQSLSTQADDTHDLAVNGARILGAHILHFGYGLRDLRVNSNSLGQSAGIFNFAANWTVGPLSSSAAAPIGQGMASFLYGLPSSGSYTIPANYAEKTATSAFYAQDDWKVTPKLTVSAGLRYELPGALTERYNRSVEGFNAAAASPVAAQAIANYAKNPIPQLAASQFQVNGGLTFAGAGGAPTALWSTPKEGFMPRVGLAYSVDQKTVIRAGYGIFDVPLGVVNVNVNQTGFSQLTSMVPTVDNINFVATLTNPFPNGFLPPTGAAGGLATGLGNGVTFINGSMKTPYMERWQIAAQRSLPGRSVLEVSYVGNHAVRQLLTRNLDALPDQYLSTSGVRDQTTINLLTGAVANPFYPLLPGTSLSGSTVARSQLLIAYPQFTSVNVLSNQGYSFYNGLQARYEKQFATGLTANVSYSWSKLIGGLGYLNAGDPMPERVINAADRPQRLVVNWIYALPFGRGQRWLKSTPLLSPAIGGWQLQGVYTHQSGPPLGFGNALLQPGQTIANVALAADQRTVQHWFNTAAFVTASSQQLSSNLISLSSLFSNVRGDGIRQFDLSVLKDTRIKERATVEFRVEAYNALNTPMLGAPTTTPTSTAFGAVTTQFSYPRTIQVALKILF